MLLPIELRKAFEYAVEEGSNEAFEALLGFLQSNSESRFFAGWHASAKVNQFALRDILRLIVTSCQSGFIAPGMIVKAWDIMSRAWLESQPALLAQLPRINQPAKIPPALWQLFWADMEAPVINNIIERIKEYHQAMDNPVRKAYVANLLEAEGVPETLQVGFLPPVATTLESLASYAPGSLGYAFYHHLNDNNLSVEFIKDRRQSVFEDDRANYIGLRIYQTHDIWHVLLGYGISGLEELGLQAFQLAQVVTPAPAILLSQQLARTLFNFNFYALPNLFNPIFEGWQHGRSTVPLLAVRWEELWSQPLASLRQDYQLQALNLVS